MRSPLMGSQIALEPGAMGRSPTGYHGRSRSITLRRLMMRVQASKRHPAAALSRSGPITRIPAADHVRCSLLGHNHDIYLHSPALSQTINMFSQHAAVTQSLQLRSINNHIKNDDQDSQTTRPTSSRQHIRRRSKQYLGLSAEAVGEVW